MCYTFFEHGLLSDCTTIDTRSLFCDCQNTKTANLSAHLHLLSRVSSWSVGDCSSLVNTLVQAALKVVSRMKPDL